MVTAMNALGEEKAMTAATMRAIVSERYGSPEALTVREIAKPVPDADRVLIQVRAASINPADLHNLKGMLVARPSSGLRRPKRPIPGVDVAGVVEVVGANVTHLHPGDEVFGTAPGSLAEFAAGKNLIPKPANITFEQAASVGIAGITALQGLRDKANLQSGQTILINGASGGVGTFAVQIAKALGGIVTGVCSGRNVELVRSIGADRVIDYTKEDFTRSGQQYDVVMDIVGNRSLSALRRLVKPGGTLVLLGGAHDRGHGARGFIRPLSMILRGKIVSRFVPQKIVSYIAQINLPDLFFLQELMEAGKLTPVVDRTYPLAEAPAAFRYLQGGHAPAKIVLTP